MPGGGQRADEIVARTVVAGVRVSDTVSTHMFSGLNSCRRRSCGLRDELELVGLMFA
jgi:hypothetical protein